MHDPWDETPDPFASDEEDAVEDPVEGLARALQRARHGGGTHLMGDWKSLYHGIRSGNAAMRAEAERAIAAEGVHAACAEAVTAVRKGRAADARVALERAMALIVS